MTICCVIERSYNEFLRLQSRYESAEGAELELLCRSPLRHRSGDKSSLEIPQDAASALVPTSSSVLSACLGQGCDGGSGDRPTGGG